MYTTLTPSSSGLFHSRNGSANSAYDSGTMGAAVSMAEMNMFPELQLLTTPCPIVSVSFVLSASSERVFSFRRVMTLVFRRIFRTAAVLVVQLVMWSSTPFWGLAMSCRGSTLLATSTCLDSGAWADAQQRAPRSLDIMRALVPTGALPPSRTEHRSSIKAAPHAKCVATGPVRTLVPGTVCSRVSCAANLIALGSPSDNFRRISPFPSASRGATQHSSLPPPTHALTYIPVTRLGCDGSDRMDRRSTRLPWRNISVLIAKCNMATSATVGEENLLYISKERNSAVEPFYHGRHAPAYHHRARVRCTHVQPAGRACHAQCAHSLRPVHPVEHLAPQADVISRSEERAPPLVAPQLGQDVRLHRVKVLRGSNRKAAGGGVLFHVNLWQPASPVFNTVTGSRHRSHGIACRRWCLSCGRGAWVSTC